MRCIYVITAPVVSSFFVHVFFITFCSDVSQLPLQPHRFVASLQYLIRVLSLEWSRWRNVVGSDIVDVGNCFGRWKGDGDIGRRILRMISRVWDVVGFLIGPIGMAIVEVVVNHEGHWRRMEI